MALRSEQEDVMRSFVFLRGWQKQVGIHDRCKDIPNTESVLVVVIRLLPALRATLPSTERASSTEIWLPSPMRGGAGGEG